ncbi:MAG: ABC transporter substrate-binding protein [Sphingobium sp.]
MAFGKQFFRRWPHIAVCIAALVCAAAPATPVEGEGPAHRPKRIVSLNLCADQLVLALADREQIAGLTRNARDRQMSAAADAARGLPLLGGSAEEVLGVDPDLVIGMPARRSRATAILRAQDYRAVDLKPANDYGAILGSIRDVAQAVGHPERGEALIARMDAALRRLPKARGRVVAAYYQRRGYMTGTGTLVNDLMTRAGVTNLASVLGKPPLSQMSLEEMRAAAPDFLVVESATDKVVDQGTAMLHHPVLSGIPRISIPQAWTVCGGPAYVDAARALSAAIAAREKHRR